MNQEQVFMVLVGERNYQDMKWGPLPAHGHEVASWIVYMDVYLQKAKEAATVGDISNALHAIRKVTALGVICGEQHGLPARD